MFTVLEFLYGFLCDFLFIYLFILPPTRQQLSGHGPNDRIC